MEQRPIVLEHRVTLHKAGCTIRFWIEASTGFDGIAEFADAERRAAESVEALAERWFSDTAEQLALALLDRVPAANSVEVCTDGNGAAVHRDWP